MDPLKRIQGLAILLAHDLCADTNADKATLKIKNAVYQGKPVGNIEVVIKIKRPKGYKKK